MKLTLMVLNAGKASGQAIVITTPQFVIGRDAKCNLRPASAMISKQHCALIIKDGKVYLKDFESTNGTFVNEQPVKGVVVLKNSDLLKVGPLTFKVVIEEEPAVAKPTPLPESIATVEEEDPAAALLLSVDIEGEGGAPVVDTTDDAEAVPGGSTEYDLRLPAGSGPTAAPAESAVAAKPAIEAKPEEKKPEAKKPATDSAQDAAKAILERFKKGRRSS